MKTITTAILVAVSTNLQAQDLNAVSNTAVWATVLDESIIPVGQESELRSDNANMQSIIHLYDITSVQQAFPSSKKEDLLNVYQFNCNCNPEKLQAELEKMDELSRVEVTPDNTPLYTPNDYQLAFTNDYALELINAEKAWDETLGDPSVEIAITDTDFDLTHQELMGTLTVVDTPFYSNYYYHGTAVAVTAAGNTNNSLGKSSIGSQCGLQLYNMNYNSILKATYNGAKVINISWGSCYYSSYAQAIIDEAYENGSIIVAAAGNGSTCNDPYAYVYPAALNHVISVSSVGPQNNHERYIGNPSSTHQHNDSVDIVAPGYDVALTVADGWYLTGNGTSFAAPYVSGTIGLMLSVNPCLTFEQVEDILYSTAYNVDTINPNYAGLLGAGRLDAGKAVIKANGYNTVHFDIQSNYNCDAQAYELVAGTLNQTSLVGTYEWSNGVTQRKTFTDQSGVYAVKYTDLNGCFGTDSITINLPTPLTLNTISTAVSCNGMQDGIVNMNYFGGFGNLELYVDNIIYNSDSLLYLSPGLYEIKVVDSIGCEVLEYAEVLEPDALEVVSTIGCDGDLTASGYIDVDVTGGTGNYSYTWDNGMTTEDLSTISAGDYSLTVLDENNCKLTETFTVCGATASLHENDFKAFNVYPNPSNGQLVNMSWEGNIDEVEIVDELGRVIISEFPTNNTLQLQNLSSGIYLIKAYTDHEQIALKKLLIN